MLLQCVAKHEYIVSDKYYNVHNGPMLTVTLKMIVLFVLYLLLCTMWETTHLDYFLNVAHVVRKILLPLKQFVESLAQNRYYKLVRMICCAGLLIDFRGWSGETVCLKKNS